MNKIYLSCARHQQINIVEPVLNHCWASPDHICSTVNAHQPLLLSNQRTHQSMIITMDHWTAVIKDQINQWSSPWIIEQQWSKIKSIIDHHHGSLNSSDQWSNHSMIIIHPHWSLSNTDHISDQWSPMTSVGEWTNTVFHLQSTGSLCIRVASFHVQSGNSGVHCT